MKRAIQPGLVILLAAGLPFTAIAMTEDDPLLYLFKADQLELREGDDENTRVFDGHFWLGKDLDKLWIKSEIEATREGTESAEWQLLYSRAIDPNWDLQIGLRADLDPEPKRNWLAIGFYGVAPYWFEVDTALFVEEDGQVNLRLMAEYEMLLTQKWVLAPEIELNWYRDDDDELMIAAGVAGVEAGIRLRYEFTRQFAPYIGVNYESLLGGTRDLARDNDAKTSDAQLVAGLRFWF
ncbi:MAG TPA: copper resistance protein B [Gammaproteobacteria bacterium]|nr:copper resistance protein B [Gammaproteobacteria bacterium]